MNTATHPTDNGGSSDATLSDTIVSDHVPSIEPSAVSVETRSPTSSILSTAEVEDLERCEATIERGLKTFYEVGSALLEIRDARLYRRDHDSFEDYLSVRWAMSRGRGYQLIAAAETFTALSTRVDIPLPKTEGQVRAIAALPVDQHAEAWTTAVATSPNGSPTCRHIAEVVKQIKAGTAIPGHYRSPETTKMYAERRHSLRGGDGVVRQARTFLGSFQDVPLEEGSIDWIVTDPPYGTNYMDLYEDLGRWASKVLSPTGEMLVMLGHYRFFDAVDKVRPHIPPHSIIAVEMPGANSMILPMRTISKWKPVVWFRKSQRPPEISGPNLYRSKSKEKDLHDWQQSVEIFTQLIESYTNNDHVVCDPMMGAGTTWVACQKLGRSFVGIERDPETYAKAIGRLEP